MLLIRLVIILAAARAVVAFSCTKQFWPHFNPGQHYTVNAECQFYPGYPKFIGTTRVSVAYTERWGRYARRIKVFDKIGVEIAKSLGHSLAEYAKFAMLPPEIVLILSRRVDNQSTNLWTTFPDRAQPTCQVTAFQDFTDIMNTNKEHGKQLIAHELYHCVQQHKMGGALSGKGSSNWVIEGSAEYFSNWVYPKANLEWPGDGLNWQYKPDTPIYDQEVYATSLFFQSLEEPRGPTAIHKWVLSTKQTNDGEAERHRLSTLAGFTDDFYTFAEQLSLGTVKDTSNVPILGLPDFKPKPVPVSNGAAIIEAIPFTVGVWRVSLPAGHAFKVSAAASPHQRLAYRFPNNKAWTAFTGLPAVFDASCTNTPILLLFISTEDASTDSIQISVESERSQKRSGQCGGDGTGFILYPLQDPLTLNAYCPSGTHVTTLAAWCCPDGSELNEENASEASVCCPKTRPDCYHEVVPNNLRCADPTWVLWTKEYRQIGCCKQGYVPTSSRYCVQDVSQLGRGYSSIAQAAAPTTAP